jgi:hypothetical protein
MLDTNTDLQMDKTDIEWATFALGRFVQYRLDEKMPEKELEPFMQAYLNLTADLDGREHLDLHELRSRIEAAGLTEQEEDRQEWPSWLRGHERLRRHLRAQKKSQSSSPRRVQLLCDSSLESNAEDERRPD